MILEHTNCKGLKDYIYNHSRHDPQDYSVALFLKVFNIDYSIIEFKKDGCGRNNIDRSIIIFREREREREILKYQELFVVVEAWLFVPFSPILLSIKIFQIELLSLEGWLNSLAVLDLQVMTVTVTKFSMKNATRQSNTSLYWGVIIEAVHPLFCSKIYIFFFLHISTKLSLLHQC